MFQEWFNIQLNLSRPNEGEFPDSSTFREWDWGIKGKNIHISLYFHNINWLARQTLDWVQERLIEDKFPRGVYK